jgi:hypothetical protein
MAKLLAFFAQSTDSLCENMIIALVFEKNAIFWQKLQKIGIITSMYPRATILRRIFANGQFEQFFRNSKSS